MEHQLVNQEVLNLGQTTNNSYGSGGSNSSGSVTDGTQRALTESNLEKQN